MALTSSLFANFSKKINEAEIDWTDDTIVVALFDNTLSADVNTDTFLDEITNYDTAELSGGNYVRKTLASKTNTVTAGETSLDAADVTWSALTGTFRYAVVFKSTGAAATDILIGIIDFDSDQPVSAGDFTITWNADGVVHFAEAA